MKASGSQTVGQGGLRLFAMGRVGIIAAYTRLLFVTIAAAAALAGCGSSASEDERAVLWRDAAARLARDSDAVAISVDRGDSCTALSQAMALRARIERTIADRRIPTELQGELRQRASSLVKAIDCVASAPSASTKKRPGGARRDHHGHHGENEHEEEDE